MTEDWKAALALLRDETSQEAEPVVPEDNDAAGTADVADGAAVYGGRRTLRMFYEKKGRAGKAATIIEGFDADDDREALDRARTLKQRIGCGGSARGGEILLQGDRREQARRLLTEMGYVVKGEGIRDK